MSIHEDVAKGASFLEEIPEIGAQIAEIVSGLRSFHEKLPESVPFKRSGRAVATDFGKRDGWIHRESQKRQKTPDDGFRQVLGQGGQRVRWNEDFHEIIGRVIDRVPTNKHLEAFASIEIGISKGTDQRIDSSGSQYSRRLFASGDTRVAGDNFGLRVW